MCAETFSKGIRLLLCLILCLGPAGCSLTNQKVSYLGNEDLGYYRDVATKIEYPEIDEPDDQKAYATYEPRSIRDPRKDEIWDLTLIEVLHTALENSYVLREQTQFLSPFNTLMRNPDGMATVFDPAIQETSVLGNRRGVEAALSDFDAQLTTNMFWGRDENIQNNRFTSGGLEPGETLVEQSFDMNNRLQKQFAYGGIFSVNGTTNYSKNNSPTRLFESVYTNSVGAEYRQPLRAGSGLEYTRIAGPIGANVNSGLPSVDRGVVIARINTDIALADFQINVRNMLRDVEALYWDLSRAYRVYDSDVKYRDTALKTYEMTKMKAPSGLLNTRVNDKYQARINYFNAKSRAENSLSNLYDIEGRLRRIAGLPVNDGRIIRPIDEPLTAEFMPDWYVCLAESLTQRVELRKQKWTIKSLEFQLKAAKSLTRSRLDFVSRYGINGFGDNLFGYDDDDGVTDMGLNSAWGTLTQGDQTSWDLGIEFSRTLGNRAANSQVRNLELLVARARKILVEQELEISHELSDAFRRLDQTYQLAETKFNERLAAEEFVTANELSYKANKTDLDLLLRAQDRLVQTEIEYYTSLIDYNKAIMEIHYRKGSLLKHNNVMLAEGEWDPKAYEDALQRAWARTYALKQRGRKFIDSVPYPFVDKNAPFNDFENHQILEPGCEILQEQDPAFGPEQIIPDSEMPSLPETVTPEEELLLPEPVYKQSFLNHAPIQKGFLPPVNMVSPDSKKVLTIPDDGPELIGSTKSKSASAGKSVWNRSKSPSSQLEIPETSKNVPVEKPPAKISSGGWKKHRK